MLVSGNTISYVVGLLKFGDFDQRSFIQSARDCVLQLLYLVCNLHALNVEKCFFRPA